MGGTRKCRDFRAESSRKETTWKPRYRGCSRRKGQYYWRSWHRSFWGKTCICTCVLFQTNTVDAFLCSEFRIVECFPRCSVYCVNAVRFPVLVFHLKEHVNKMWRNRKAFLKWYSVVLLLAREDFLHVSVFHEHVYGEHCMKTDCTHFTHSLCKIYSTMRLEFCHWLHTNRHCFH